MSDVRRVCELLLFEEIRVNGRDFYDRLNSHALLEYIGVRDAVPAAEDSQALPDRAIVRDHSHEVDWEVTISSILSHPWEELEGVLLGRRSAGILTHVARIVGYYSFTRNWNGSKIKELDDRHQGNYNVPNRTPDMDGELPDEIVDTLAEGGAGMSCDLDKRNLTQS